MLRDEDLCILVFTFEFEERKLFVSPPKLFMPPPSHATLAPGLSHSRPSTTKLIPRVEIRQENLSIDRITKYFSGFYRNGR